jgi:phosphoribosyl-ATP pyrophosphohydrolase/phosphoribosyl-AMP cyclohydrolase
MELLMDLEKLKFDEKGLIPAIVVDAVSGKVLTLAYMNKESLAISIEKGLTCFYSRSRQQLWLKGETSGNFQHIVSITADCDYDALVIEVEKDGPACHEGTDSCFHNSVFDNPELQSFSLEGLMDLLKGRKEQLPEGSYTTYLFQKGKEKILKKVGEECTETVIAAKNLKAAGEDADKDALKSDLVGEVADLFYHLQVMLADVGLSIEDVLAEHEKRNLKVNNKKVFKTVDKNS